MLCWRRAGRPRSSNRPAVALAAPLSPAASWVLREAAAAFAADGPEP